MMAKTFFIVIFGCSFSLFERENEPKEKQKPCRFIAFYLAKMRNSAFFASPTRFGYENETAEPRRRSLSANKGAQGFFLNLHRIARDGTKKQPPLAQLPLANKNHLCYNTNIIYTFAMRRVVPLQKSKTEGE